MGLKNIFRSSSSVLEKNNELLEEHDLLNIMGSPNRIFLKFLNSKDININEDEITEDLIEEFESSVDSINLRLEKVQKEKEIIVKQRKVWINIPAEDEPLGSDLILDHDSVTIDETGQKIAYADMTEIVVEEGGWSKKKMTIKTEDGDP